MYDLIIRNGMVVDGTRAPAYQADVCIQNGRIAEITAQCGAEAKEVIDAAGKVVSPGFIDIHTHSDLAPLSPFDPESKTGIAAFLRSQARRRPEQPLRNTT